MRLLVLFGVVALLGSAVVVVHRAFRPDTALSSDLVSAERMVEDVARRVLADPFQMVMPAELAPHHRSVPELADCKACHGLTSNVQDDRCLGCHQDVAQRLEDRAGHHGRNLRGSCERCHADHQAQLIELEQDAFRHDQALFALTGAHAQVECAACHQNAAPEAGRHPRMNYIGLAYERCTDCHESPHAEGVSTQDCTSCHVSAGWSGTHLRFDHDTQADFRLDATHRGVTCGGCHQSQVFRPLGGDCESCHSDVEGFMRGAVTVGGALESWVPSPHAGLVGCSDCHDTAAATQDASTFAQACARCHTPMHAQLYLDRNAHLSGLVLEGRRLATSPEQRALLDTLERVGSHAYPAAEQRARALVEELRR